MTAAPIGRCCRHTLPPLCSVRQVGLRGRGKGEGPRATRNYAGSRLLHGGELPHLFYTVQLRKESCEKESCVRFATPEPRKAKM